MTEPFESDPYAALGVAPFINCCGTRSVHGGSLILPSVMAAMAAASRQFVNIGELMDRARLRIAALTGAEDGIVTSGSAAAIAIATAASMVANNPLQMLKLPRQGRHPHRVAMLRGHRFPYDQAIRMVGAEILEIDGLNDLVAADRDEIAMIAYLASRDSSASVPLEQLVTFGRNHGIPVLVDAASLPLRRPDAWLGRGADLVVYSGGKLLRGPQGGGLLLGSKELIDAAWANSPPHRAFGRPMKLGKEDIVGVVAALEAWFERDVAAEQQRWRADCETLQRLVSRRPGTRLELQPPDEGEDAPTLELSWEQPVHGLELRRRLLAGTPRIMLDDNSATERSIKLEVVSLAPGEAELVGHALVAALREPEPAPETENGAVDISGDWGIELLFPRRPGLHRLELQQWDGRLGGEQSCDDFAGPVSGTVAGHKVRLVFETTYEGAILTYCLDGSLKDGELVGTATLGSVTPHGRGEINASQYGTVRWRGRRLD